MALNRIWVFAEAADGKVAPITLEMLQLCGVQNVMSFRNRIGTPVPIGHLLAQRAA